MLIFRFQQAPLNRFCLRLFLMQFLNFFLSRAPQFPILVAAV
jgi:hypothetical protein